MRESLFNILRETVDGAVFLDLFAGSGAVGIEALSRGAKKALFVDSSRVCGAGIRKNLESLALTGLSEIIVADAARRAEADFRQMLAAGLARLGETAFDIVFADPPYRLPELCALPQRICATGLLSERALLVIEHGRRTPMPDEAGEWVKCRVKAYGDTEVSFYRHPQSQLRSATAEDGL